MASRPLAMRLRSSHVRNIENSEEECSECGLNAVHHSGEAKHENSRYEWVEQIAKIQSGPRPHRVTKCRQAENEQRPTDREDSICVRPSQHAFRAHRAWEKATFQSEIL